MRRFHSIAGALGAASLLALAAPAFAEGKHDRAQEAIAAAHAKIDAANRVGAGMNTPHLAAGAEAALRLANEDLSAGHKEDAIRDAIKAQQLADTALNQAQASHAQANAEQHATAVAAQQDAAEANARAEAATAQAGAAAQAANSAAADAQNARAELAEAQSQPAQATTVTTETTKSAPVARTHTAVRHTTVRRHSAPAATETTRTTVTTAPSN